MPGSQQSLRKSAGKALLIEPLGDGDPLASRLFVVLKHIDDREGSVALREILVDRERSFEPPTRLGDVACNEISPAGRDPGSNVIAE